MNIFSKYRLELCIVFVICVAVPLSWAIDQDSGLAPMPGWTKTDQLKEKWGKIAFADLRAQAEKGDPEAQHYLAWCYFQGVEVPKDVKVSAEWYRKAAEQGFALAQNNLGYFYQTGEGVPKDLNEAVRWFRRAADQGLPVALNNLGDIAYRGEIAELKQIESRKFFELAAERGDCDAAISLAYSHSWGGIPGASLDYNLAAYWYSFAAKNGCVMAYNNVGWLYLQGRGVPLDFDEAFRWFEMGAKLDEPYCFYGLGMHELTANKSAPDLAKARSWLLKAAEKKVSKAWFQLGRLAELWDIVHGPNLEPNYEEAAKWYQLAADDGFRQAAQRLAELAAEGKIGSGDDAITRLQKSSDLGNRKAQLELAQIYLRGEAKPRGPEDDPLTLLKGLLRAGNPPAKLVMADLYRTGQRVPKDPMQALFLIHSALITASDDNGNAHERFYDLKEATDRKRPVAVFNRGLEDVFPLYFDAVYNNQSSASSLKIARNYLDGTYATNEVAACAWFSVAARRGAAEAVAERDRLLQKLDADGQQEATRMGELIHFFFQLGAP